MVVHTELQTYYESAQNGVAHLIMCNDTGAIVKDLPYSTVDGSGYDCDIELLGYRCRIVRYHCGSVSICSKMPQNMREANHFRVGNQDKQVLKVIQSISPREEMDRRAAGICRELNRKVREGKFCGSQVFETTRYAGQLEWRKCKGKPVLRYAYGKAFIGCDMYRANETNHYYRSLKSLDDQAVKLLESYLGGQVEPPEYSSECHFVAPKTSKKRYCVLHGEERPEIVNLRSSRPCPVEICTVTPKNPDAGCAVIVLKGVHNHPPPPPPPSRTTLLKLFEKEAQTQPHLSKSALLHIVKRRMDENGESSTQVSTKAAGRVLKSLSTPRTQLTLDVADLIAECASGSYCLDFVVAAGDYVCGIATNEMLYLASLHRSFAGDATFRTLRQPGRKICDQWKLYNICVMVRLGALDLNRGAVVFRAFTTGSSAVVYKSIWKMFFQQVTRVRSQPMKPAYMLSEREVYSRIQISSITTDYEVSEVEGICQALSETFGCDPDFHAKRMMIGCKVHAIRDFLRRSGQGRNQRLFQYLCSLREAQTEERARSVLKKVENLDPEWAKWVLGDFVLPLMAPAFSSMSLTCRALGLDTTNVCESHNARGNRLAGTNLDVRNALKKLESIDHIEMREILSGTSNDYAASPRPLRKFRKAVPRRKSSRLSATPAGVVKSKAKRGKKLSTQKKKKLLEKLQTLLFSSDESETEKENNPN